MSEPNQTGQNAEEISEPLEPSQSNKKARKEQLYLVFTVNGVKFLIEREFIPENSILKTMIDNPDDDTNIKEKIDPTLLNIIIQDIRKKLPIPIVKHILNKLDYENVLHIIRYFNMIYDHTLRFDLHWFSKHVFTCNNKSDKCCGFKELCVFDINNNYASVHILYNLSKKKYKLTGYFKYEIEENNNIVIRCEEMGTINIKKNDVYELKYEHQNNNLYNGHDNDCFSYLTNKILDANPKYLQAMPREIDWISDPLRIKLK